MDFRDKVCHFILNKPKQSLLLASILISILLPGLALIKSDFSYRAWYSEDDPLLINYDKFEHNFGNDDSVVVAIESNDSLITPKGLKLIYQFTEDMWTVPGIVRVDSLSNYDFIESEEESINVGPLISEDNLENISPEFLDKIKTKVAPKKLVNNILLSKDSKLTLIKGVVKPSLKARTDNKEIIDNIRGLIQKYEKECPEFSYHFAGTATFIHIFREITEHDIGILLPMLMLIFLIILYLLYRHIAGVIIPFVCLITSVIMMLGMSGYFGHAVTTISSAAPSILLTVAIADAIHILTVYFFGLKQGYSPEESIKYSLVKNFYPTLLTTLTTCIGFLSFSNSLIKSVAHMGIEVGIGVIFAWISCYFIIGPLIVLFKPILKKEKVSSQEIHYTDLKISPFVKNLVKFIDSNKIVILSISFIMAVLSFYGMRSLEINLNPNDQFKEDHPYKHAMKSIESHTGTISQMEMMIETDTPGEAKTPTFLKNVERLENWLLEQSYIEKTISLNDILKDLNQAFFNDPAKFVIPSTVEQIGQHILFYSLGLPVGREITNLINYDSSKVRMSAVWTIDNSKEANLRIAEIQTKAQEFGLKASVTGKMPLFHELTPYVVSSFIQSFSIALLAIFIILVFVLKSFKIGTLALIPNTLPLILGAGIYSLSGEYLDIASVLIASVCLGIAVDDSIHFLFEYNKFKKLNLPTNKIFEIIFTNTAPSLFNTTTLIAIGFGSFIFAEYIPNAKFGIMVSIILILALIADFFILPALLLITDKTSQHK